jgi:hypothetical protein
VALGYDLAFVPECYGTWTVSASATYFNYGDANASANAVKNDEVNAVVFGGVGGLRRLHPVFADMRWLRQRRGEDIRCHLRQGGKIGGGFCKRGHIVADDTTIARPGQMQGAADGNEAQ